MQKHACILAATLLLAHVSQAQETSELALKVTPAFKWTTDAVPYGDIQLRNPGTATAEITIVATGIEVAPDRPAKLQTIGDLSKHLTVFPPRLIIPPGETRIVRYAVMDPAPLSEGGHVALIHARMARRTPVDQLQTPSAATALRINYELIVPLILLKGVGEPEIVVQIASQDDEKIILDLSNQGNSPWAGTIRVSSAGRTAVIWVGNSRHFPAARSRNCTAGSAARHFPGGFSTRILIGSRNTVFEPQPRSLSPVNTHAAAMAPPVHVVSVSQPTSRPIYSDGVGACAASAGIPGSLASVV